MDDRPDEDDTEGKLDVVGDNLDCKRDKDGSDGYKYLGIDDVADTDSGKSKDDGDERLLDIIREAEICFDVDNFSGDLSDVDKDVSRLLIVIVLLFWQRMQQLLQGVFIFAALIHLPHLIKLISFSYPGRD